MKEYSKLLTYVSPLQQSRKLRQNVNCNPYSGAPRERGRVQIWTQSSHHHKMSTILLPGKRAVVWDCWTENSTVHAALFGLRSSVIRAPLDKCPTGHLVRVRAARNLSRLSTNDADT